MRNPWSADGEPFPPPPPHPEVAHLAAQLDVLRPLLACWGWDEIDGQVVLLVMFAVDHTTVRVILGDDQVNVDVYVTTMSPEVGKLTWLLSHNAMRRWKSRVSRVGEDGALQVYVQAFFPRGRLHELVPLLWDALHESWAWRGQFLAWEVSPTH